jgi:hypothetical protein
LSIPEKSFKIEAASALSLAFFRYISKKWCDLQTEEGVEKQASAQQKSRRRMRRKNVSSTLSCSYNNEGCAYCNPPSVRLNGERRLPCLTANLVSMALHDTLLQNMRHLFIRFLQGGVTLPKISKSADWNRMLGRKHGWWFSYHGVARRYAITCYISMSNNKI